MYDFSVTSAVFFLPRDSPIQFVHVMTSSNFLPAMWVRAANENLSPLCRKMKTFVIIVDKSIEICMRRDCQASSSSSSFRVVPELSKLSETS